MNRIMDIKKTKLIIPGLLIFLCSCELFTPHDCEDIVYHLKTEYVPYVEGDSITFKNVKTNEYYYIKCAAMDTYTVKLRTVDSYCKNGEYFYIWDDMFVQMFSNFPFEQDLYAGIKIHIFSMRNGFNFYFEGIDQFLNQVPDSTFYKIYTGESTRLYAIDTTKLKIIYNDMITINGKNYSDVDIIINKDTCFYDKIYYNKTHGILKLVSSQYGYDFEIAGNE